MKDYRKALKKLLRDYDSMKENNYKWKDAWEVVQKNYAFQFADFVIDNAVEGKVCFDEVLIPKLLADMKNWDIPAKKLEQETAFWEQRLMLFKAEAKVKELENVIEKITCDIADHEELRDRAEKAEAKVTDLEREFNDFKNRYGFNAIEDESE